MTHGKNVVVPVEPTEAMLSASFDAFEIDQPKQYADGTAARKAIWSAMLAAAPAPSSLAGGEREGLARIIDPWAFEFEPWNENWTSVCAQRKSTAVAKADAILAALSPEAPARLVCMGIDAAEDAPQDFKDFAVEFNRRQTASETPARVVGTIAHVSNGRSELAAQITAALTPRHEAPAEGAGEVALAARALLDACYKADENSDLSDFVDGMLLARLDKALRARSSAPEASEGEAAGQVNALYASGFGRMRCIEWAAGDMPEVGTKLYTHPAAPSADKRRIAVEALEYIDGRKSIAPVWVQQRVRSALAALKAEGAA